MASQFICGCCGDKRPTLGRRLQRVGGLRRLVCAKCLTAPHAVKLNAQRNRKMTDLGRKVWDALVSAGAKGATVDELVLRTGGYDARIRDWLKTFEVRGEAGYYAESEGNGRRRRWWTVEHRPPERPRKPAARSAKAELKRVRAIDIRWQAPEMVVTTRADGVRVTKLKHGRPSDKVPHVVDARECRGWAAAAAERIGELRRTS